MSDNEQDDPLTLLYQERGNVWLRVREEFACDHPEQVVTRFRDSQNHAHFRMQCLRCGVMVGSVKRQTIALKHLDTMREWDAEIGTRYQSLRDARFTGLRDEIQAKIDAEQARRDEERANERAEWSAWYNNDYLQTPHWRAMRRKILKRSNGVCEGCGDRPPVLVHHRTYKRLGHEMLFDLVALCRPCHQVMHPEKHAEQASETQT